MGEHLYTSLPYCNMNVYPDIQEEGIYRNAFVSTWTRLFYNFVRIHLHDFV